MAVVFAPLDAKDLFIDAANSGANGQDVDGLKAITVTTPHPRS
jgi:hypothetical protein